MKRIPKRILAFLLSMVMVLGAIPVEAAQVQTQQIAELTEAVSENEPKETVSENEFGETEVPLLTPMAEEQEGNEEETQQQLLTLDTDYYYIIYDAYDENGTALDAKSGNSRVLFENGGNNEGWLKYGSSYNRDYSSKYFWKLEEGDQEGTYHMRSQGYQTAFAVLAEGARANGGQWVISEKNPNHKGSPMKFVVMATEGDKTYVAIQSVPYTDPAYGELTAEKYMTTEDFAMTETTDETNVRCYVHWTDEVTATDRTKGWWVIEKVMKKDETMPGGVQGRSLLFRTEPLQYHYRIPAVATNNNGDLVVVADYRYDSSVDIGTNWGGWNGTDYSGFGNKGHRIDLVTRISEDDGQNWSSEKNLTSTYSYKHNEENGTLSNGYGDPAVVADRETDKVYLMSVGGSYGFNQDNAGVVSMLSTDGGRNFTAPKVEGGRATSTTIDEETGIYGWGKELGWASLFFSSGRIMQSRYIKVGESYRIYSAPLVRHKDGGKYNYVFYSDDFGTTWKMLPGAAISGADEAKVDELPNGSVVITSRKGGGRKVNVFTYDETDATRATGSWGTQAEMNIGRNTNATNGELYIVYAKKADGTYGYLALQSLPAAANGKRQEVRIFYKWIYDSVDTPQEFVTGWSIEDSYVLQENWSAYSVLGIQNNGKIAAVWEESDNAYDIVYAGIDLSTITGGKYTAAFTEGIGSKKSPFKVSTVEQARAVNSVYKNEKVNWDFTGEAEGMEDQEVTEERLEGSTEIPTSEMIMSAGSIQTGNATEGEAKFVIDGDIDTLWHTDYNGSTRDKHWIQVKLKSDYKVDGLKVIPRQSGTNGMITEYEILVSTDRKTWTKVKEGSWEQDIEEKEEYFAPVDARYVRLVAKQSLPLTGTLFASLAELRLTGVKTGESGPIVPEEETREVLTLSEDKFYLIYDAFDEEGNPLDGTSADSKTMYDNGGSSEGYIKVNGSFRYDDNFSSAYLWSMEESPYEGSYYMRSAHSDNALGVLAENALEIEERKVVSDMNANHKGSPMKFVVMKEEGNKKYVAIQSLKYTDEEYGDLTDQSYMTADESGEFVQWTDEVNSESKDGWWVIEEVMGKDEPIPVGVQGRELLWRSSPLNYHYRIPAIGTNNAGELISVADYRYYYACDIGYWGGWNGTNWGGFGYGHRIDLVSRLSNDQGITWGEERNHTKELTTEGTAAQRANAYGDPSVVGDRESDKVLVLAVGGGLGFMNDKAGIISMLSNDGGHTFGAPVGVGGSLLLESVPEGVTDAYDLEPGVEWTSMFITSGRITQSRYIKVGESYRLYVAPLTRIGSNNKNWVFYSDDFGKTWAALPGCAIDGADEAKVEELPNGNVVITSRKGSGRYVNIFTYAEGDTTYSTGSWGTQAEFNVGSTRGTNGDLYITYAKNQQGEYGYVAIQTLPTYVTSARKDVRIAYKWLDADTATPEKFAEGWSLENTFQLQPTHAAYSAMTWQSDGTFGFLWEENDNSYDIVYKKLTLSEITGGKFTSAFTEGIGSVKSPFKVETIEQAQAVKGIYANEEMNWRFVGEAKQYMTENHPGEYEEPEFEASLTMDTKSGLRIRAWKKTETIHKIEAQIIEHTEEKIISHPYVSLENTEDYFTKYVEVNKGTSEIKVRLIAYTDEGATAIKDLQVSGSNISGEAVNDLWVRFLDGYGEDNKNYVYTGSAIKPKVQVYEGTTLLTEKKDYTLSYKNNTNVYNGSEIGKTPQVIVTGKGNYKGKEIAAFTIIPKDIENEDAIETLQTVTIADMSAVGKNKVQKPVPVITYGKKKLTNKKDKDFTVTYPDTQPGAYQNPGVYKVKIEGKNNYRGIIEIDFTIGGKLMKNMKVGKIANQTYTGSEIFIEDLKVSDGNTVLIGGRNYELEYVNNKEIGKATIIIKAREDQYEYVGSKTVTFNIVGTAISKATVDPDSLPKSVVYDGQEKEPEIKLTWKKDKNAAAETLVKGTDYEVDYDKNLDAGTATVIITGKGRFNGIMKKTFKILPFDVTADSQKKLSVETGIEIAYAKGGAKPQPQVTFGDVVLKEGVDYTLSYSNNKAVTQSSTVKKPQVKVTFKKNFKGSLSEEFTILPQDISKVTILAQDKVYSTKKDSWKTTITLTDLDGKKLTSGTDYEKAFSYFTDEACTVAAQAETYPAGTTLWVKVEGKNNYAGSSITGSYRIVKASVAKATVKIAPQYYTSEAITLDKEDISVKISGAELKYGVDYIIVEDSYINNTKKGTAKVQIKGIGDNYGGVKTVSFSIKQKSFLFRVLTELFQ